MMQDILVVGGHINHDNTDKGNVFNVPSNKFAELNMFLDPLDAKTVLSSEFDITLIPLGIQRKFSAFPRYICWRNPRSSTVLKSTFDIKKIEVTATGYESVDGQIIIDVKQVKSVKVLENVDHLSYYNNFANRLSDEK
ncbi:hypothetical protein RDI58_001573 [Solanum bulbocastanum]|uniref:Inosine/uridine-preferring nucleoside hydrolase domain-containing protein n=1 Tax=Solanum bulbocastanum TaxID=147425 RepID=A0AAN8YQ98_SOLBU